METQTGITQEEKPEAPLAHLRVHWPSGHKTTLELGKKRITAGRAPGADLQFPEMLKLTSRRHFEIFYEDGRYQVNDLGSQNGTLVNNQMLTAGVPVALYDGDVIRVGDNRTGSSIGLTFHQPGATLVAQGGWKPAEATIAIQRFEVFKIGRAQDNDLVLPSLIVSRRHASLTETDEGYLLRDLDSQNGTFVNGVRIESARMNDGDLIEIGEHLFQFQDGTLTPYSSRGFRLDAIGLSKTIARRRSKRQILYDIDMTLLPKEFLAVVGASGSGKTTLVRALNGTSPGDGQVLINGRDFYSEYDLFRHQIGYVPQFDILHNALTVDQALDYTARLRLPPELSEEERRKRVDQALQTVSMDAPETRRNRIANLSGGQRKRVSIAAELIADPRLIFLDEATSGLDPGLEKKMMYTLRRMADEGRTVVLITHATANIIQADLVAFLAQGRLVYFGSPEESLSFFEVKAFADIYERIGDEDTDWETVFRENKLDLYEQNVLKRQQSLRALPTQEIKPRGWRPIDFLRQLIVLTERAFKVIMSDWVTLLLLMLLFPLTAGLQLVIATPHVITGDPVYLADAAAAAQEVVEPYMPFADMNTFVFVMGLEAVLVGLFVPSTELLKERTVYLRERMINLGVLPYLLSKVIVFTCFSFIQVLLYMLVLALGVDYPADGIFLPGALEIFTTLFLTMMAGNALGLVISALSRNNEVAIYLLTLMLFFQFFFAGAVFDLREKPAEALSYMTTTRWSLSALGSTIDMEGITESTVLCSTLDDPFTPETDEITRCFHYPEASEDLLLPYGEDELLGSWGALAFTMLFGLGVTGLLIKRLDTL